MAPLRLRAPERIWWITAQQFVRLQQLGGGIKASAKGSDPRGVQNDEDNRAST